MERFRVEVGREHGVETGDLVGAIASEADIRAEFIGRVDIHDDHSLVELPEGMPKFMLKELRRVWVRGRQLGISRLGAEGGPRTPAARPPADRTASKVRRDTKAETRGERPGKGSVPRPRAQGRLTSRANGRHFLP